MPLLDTVDDADGFGLGASCLTKATVARSTVNCFFCPDLELAGGQRGLGQQQPNHRHPPQPSRTSTTAVGAWPGGLRIFGLLGGTNPRRITHLFLQPAGTQLALFGPMPLEASAPFC